MTPIETPDGVALNAIATDCNLSLAPDELQAAVTTVSKMASALNDLDRLAPLTNDLVRSPGSRRWWRPESAENRLGAWYVRSEICERDHGRLQGKTVAIKDSIAVAGIPLANGSVILEGYVPDFDATVVTRVLMEGATVAGKAVCEPMCLSASGHSAHTGPVRNPYALDHCSGGSSSGNGALVASGAVDMAIGGDNGGSIRIPSSWCGIYGLKPTWGLVPYTGAFAMNAQIDHLGPMAATMQDLTLLLEVLAGPDGLDPRQSECVTLSETTVSSPRNLRVGLLSEGFRWPGKSDPEVDGAVEEAAAAFRAIGASVTSVSVPLHRESAVLVGALGIETGRDMFDNDGIGGPYLGYTSSTMTESFDNAWRGNASQLPLACKIRIIASRYMLSQNPQPQLALARNIGLVLRRSYDVALRDVDVLVLPTVTHRAPRLPEGALTAAEELSAASGQSINTSPFNMCGHPSLNVPCAVVGGLPVGMMFVGRRGDDATVMQAGRFFADEIYTPPRPATVDVVE